MSKPMVRWRWILIILFSFCLSSKAEAQVSWDEINLPFEYKAYSGTVWNGGFAISSYNKVNLYDTVSGDVTQLDRGGFDHLVRLSDSLIVGASFRKIWTYRSRTGWDSWDTASQVQSLVRLSSDSFAYLTEDGALHVGSFRSGTSQITPVTPPETPLGLTSDEHGNMFVVGESNIYQSSDEGASFDVWRQFPNVQYVVFAAFLDGDSCLYLNYTGGSGRKFDVLCPDLEPSAVLGDISDIREQNLEIYGVCRDDSGALLVSYNASTPSYGIVGYKGVVRIPPSEPWHYLGFSLGENAGVLCLPEDQVVLTETGAHRHTSGDSWTNWDTLPIERAEVTSFSTDRNGHLVAATWKSLYVSSDFGNSWNELGDSVSGDGRWTLFRSSVGNVYALYRSTVYQVLDESLALIGLASAGAERILGVGAHDTVRLFGRLENVGSFYEALGDRGWSRSIAPQGHSCFIVAATKDGDGLFCSGYNSNSGGYQSWISSDFGTSWQLLPTGARVRGALFSNDDHLLVTIDGTIFTWLQSEERFSEVFEATYGTRSSLLKAVGDYTFVGTNDTLRVSTDTQEWTSYGGEIGSVTDASPYVDGRVLVVGDGRLFSTSDPIVTPAWIQPPTVQAASDLNLMVYPNPSSQRISFDVGRTSIGTGRIEVIDVLGRLVTTQDFEILGSVSIDVSELSPGTYFVKIVSGRDRLRSTFVRM